MGRGQSLRHLLKDLADVTAANDCDVHGITIDSREISVGDLFIAYRGERTDGTQYIQDAIAAGAVAVVFDGDIDAVAVNQVPTIQVSELQRKVGVIAARFFAQPSQQLWMVGITGTNGKTSCCHFLSQALQLNGDQCGVMGTLGYGLPGALQLATHTTPNPVVLQSHLKEMVDAGASSVVMEASSHALEQARVAAVAFDVAVFTNLTRDHLDYHGDLEAYGAAKQTLFEMPGLSHAVINRDDDFGVQLLAALPTSVDAVAYGLLHASQDAGALLAADVRGVYGEVIRLDEAGIKIRVVTSWGEGVLHSKHLLGAFNASNLLAVLSVLLLKGLSFEKALALLAQVGNANGRMERLGGVGGQPLVVIDYAHTPDALQNVLLALRDHCRGRLVCLFGCGGDRDRGKRSLMGAVAAQYADEIVITDDNPRFEDAALIVRDIMMGIETTKKVTVIHERAAAIRIALKSSTAADVVVVAGKGHESFQRVAEQKLPFNDRECVLAILREVA
ncbi:MAG: UDP-N-acetylmuramoyl-L-alanyl-D-glutamate--2,6-diaminopimelate ligase [Thiotrichaceae bacterium]|nr:UDP-N-acetylmuramoyl-L-alanyl-D-glutamate--2,6-diaminopimelate ligase [Thiotrichaceae bacterium]PCI10618.1 MAG: UDP-N-acetylmuramoyl-L-alanyl-D-glutamate--2,6-diaminopimelate ligase [Thiotrichales bacterium]PCI11731.1 MAG: UDP-N-acetylmuramoyl-L-alanyl-D-glutamate--2,6-diaminopimelate ligase [Thiotrichales bacterium]